MILRKRAPDEPQLRLVTEAEAERIEHMWQRRTQWQEAIQCVAIAGVSEREFRFEFRPGEHPYATARRILDGLVGVSGGVNAAMIVLLRREEKYAEALYYQRRQVSDYLNRLLAAGIDQVELRASQVDFQQCGHACAWHGKVFRTISIIANPPVPSEACTKTGRDGGRTWACTCAYYPVTIVRDRTVIVHR